MNIYMIISVTSVVVIAGLLGGLVYLIQGVGKIADKLECFIKHKTYKVTPTPKEWERMNKAKKSDLEKVIKQIVENHGIPREKTLFVAGVVGTDPEDSTITIHAER